MTGFSIRLESPPMKKRQAIRRAGSSANLARLLGVTPQSVSGWGDELPPLRVYQLRELRPSWFPRRPRR